MSNAEHEQVHRDLGVYLLGALEPAERDRFESHLSGCAICRDELADLAVVPSLLSRVGDSVLATSVAPSFEPIIERLAHEQRGRRRRERTLAGVAAVVAAVTVLVLLAGLPRTVPTGLAYATRDGGVTATVEEKSWGMAVHIAAQELPPRDGYVALAVARDGHRTQIASWSNTGRPATVTGACYLDPAELTQVEILDATQDEVIAVLTAGG